MKQNIIIYKDGSYKFVEVRESWEYENDPDWLTTIVLPIPAIEINANHILDSIKTVYTNLALGRHDNNGILSAVIADFEELIRELTNPAPPSSPTATAEEQEIILKFLDWYDGDLGVLKDHNLLIHEYFTERKK